ncbi:hypothetical protein [Hippea maritima]|uniref:Uncharacterized protein n=1 Tax=Hippea maritima (strain ATCC 700847 / DSM 10411 / MH2) TaxID=760142 RepID=F2LY57_HIPMA|nr:hypothetical protein [Hippea maritima]AEA34380.1 hypothetical protein Hipma_1424 [Hippea maritima DSM 10411]
MAEKIKVELKKEMDKLFLRCEAFGIAEYCVTEEEAENILKSKLPQGAEIEWVKEYMEKDT